MSVRPYQRSLTRYVYHWMNVSENKQGTSEIFLDSIGVLYEKLNEWNKPNPSGGYTWKYWYTGVER